MGDLDRFCEFSERFLIDEAGRPLVVAGLQGGVVIRGWVQVFEPSLSRAGRLPWLAVGYAEVRLLNGDVFTVEGTLDEVESKLSDAARSGQSRLAWFTEYGTGGSVGVNPAHVAILKVSENSD